LLYGGGFVTLWTEDVRHGNNVVSCIMTSPGELKSSDRSKEHFYASS
jgi:hypothetical protein